MRKETINTFSDGMSLDLNPLGTPAKTLTNCLNGTLITYNGNELTLQNDMGNAEVGTAALPKGYVPVGMKEYGGIIYVASYNPETKKGLLGCFPSPLQIYISEAAQTVFDFNILKLFIEFFNTFPVILNNEYKEEIFKDSITQEAKIFSSGDMFLIKTNEPYGDNIREAIDKNIISLKLFIIPINGEEPIDITLLLHTYQDNWQVPLWIYLNVDNISFESLLADHRDLLLTYKGPQGTLEVVIEFNTFELFNLYRLFYNSGNLFEVKFIGEATSDQVNKYSLMPFGLYGSINEYGHSLNNITEIGQQSDPNNLIAQTERKRIPNNGTLYYDIMPASPYGILKLHNNNFLKSGELTTKGILNSHNKITNWNFEINTNSAIILWTYTLFDGDPEIDHMRFVFIPLDKVLEQGGMSKELINLLYVSNLKTNEPNDVHVYTINKSHYSGDFEDKIIIDDEGLLHNYIYLCRLDVIYKEGEGLRAENGHDYKLLYTGTFFNDKNIQLFNNNRPEVIAEVDLDAEQTYTIKSFNYTTILEDVDSTENKPKFTVIPNKETVTANDIMFLANNERYYKKIVGIILNIECEVTSTLSIKDEDIILYNNEKLSFRPTFAGRISTELTLDACATKGKITCMIESKSVPNYEGDGDDIIQKELKKYIVEEEIDDLNQGNYKPLDGATITYTKQGASYLNTSTIRIHRGIMSRMGQEDFYSVLLEGLFPVYEPDDNLYNERLFGFNIGEDGDLSNIIGGENFMGLSMWLAKNRALDATTSVKESMITIERSYSSKTSLSRYDFKGDAQTPYHYGSYISEGIGIVNYGSEGTSRIEAMQKCNYAPILIIASNEYERVWDKSYWDGDVDSRICNLMVLPHSEFGENLRNEIPPRMSPLDEYSISWDKDKENKYGDMARIVRNLYITGTINNLGENKRNLFKVSRGNTRGMYILWRSLYGYQLMNIATPLNIESSLELSELVTVNVKDNKHLQVTWDYDKDENKTYPASETHLRADHMLLCLLSLILITKRKNTNLLLNAPDVSLIYSTTAFKNRGLLSLSTTNDPVVVLEEKNIEEALNHILANGTLAYSDNFIPKFKVNKYSNGYIDCGGKVSISSDRFGMINLDNLFFAEGIPEFSTVSDEERLNIYPGKIEKVFGQYVCKIEKDRFGLYQINEDLIEVVDGKRKFYKIFLPTIHSLTNKEGAKYSCKNTETYKQMLEGFAYNDVLLPLTRIMQLQGKDIGQLNSQEDLEEPFFNLLYYNSIDLNFELESSNLEEFVMHDVNCGCSVPVDYCHGFAFITLFGDLSRYLDSGVYLRNLFNHQTFSGADINLGYTNSDHVKDEHKCCCHDVFGVDRRAYLHRTLPPGSNQFKLGTDDWATAKLTLSTFTTASNTSDDGEKSVLDESGTEN